MPTTLVGAGARLVLDFGKEVGGIRRSSERLSLGCRLSPSAGAGLRELFESHVRGFHAVLHAALQHGLARGSVR
jgi:hypothetical protein